MTPATRTVVIVSPDFPPGSLPSSIRARLFATHLAEFGWTPVIITTRSEYYTSPLDPDNERLLPPGLEVIRTNALPVRWMRRLGIGDVGIRSLWYHWRALRSLCKSRLVDLVFITIPPNVPMVLGRFARAFLGVPYIVDYQDPWITEVYWKLPRAQRPPKWPLAYAMARLLEPFALKRASHITAVSDGTARSVLARYPRLKALGATALPFGAEPGDFAFLRSHPRPNRFFSQQDGRLHVVYTGVCIPGMYPALRCLFGGVRELRARDPDFAAKARLHFIGTNYAPGSTVERVMPLAREFEVADLVNEFTERVAYLDALQILLDATALLVIGTDEPHYTASKIYPYALSGKPVFSILHEQSSAVESLTNMGATNILTFSKDRPAELQSGAAATHLANLLTSEPAGGNTINIAGHTARDMTQRLAAVFDRVMKDVE